MKKTLSLLSILCTFNIVQAQFLSNTDYDFSYGNYVEGPHSGKTLVKDNYVYSIGRTAVSGEGQNILLKKHHMDGTLSWETTYSNPGNTIDYGVDIWVDTDGNVYALGAVDNGLTGYDVLLAKYTAVGSSNWTYTYHSTGNQDDVPTSLTFDNSGNAYITGTADYGSGSDDVLLLSVDGTGALRWDQSYDYDGQEDGGVLTTVSGSELLSFAITTGDGGQRELSRIASDLSTGSQNSVHRSTTAANIELYDLKKAPNGNYHACGSYISGSGDLDIAVYSFSSTMGINWSYTYGDPGPNDVAMALDFDASSNVYVTGTVGLESNTQSQRVFKCSSAGNLEWAFQLDAPDMRSTGLCLTVEENHVWCAGNLDAGAGNDHFFTMALTQSGSVDWYQNWKREAVFEVHDFKVTNQQFVLAGAQLNAGSATYRHVGGSLYYQNYTPVTDAGGENLYMEDQLMVKFKRHAINPDFIDNVNMTFGQAGDVLTAGIRDSLEDALDTLVDWDSVTFSKLFPYYTSTDTADTNVFGDTIGYSSPWSKLLLHFEQDIDELQIDTLLDTLKYGVLDRSSLNYFLKDRAAPAEDYFYLQLGLHDDTGIDESIDWLEAYEGDYLRYMSPIRVGVVDGGINWNHEDFLKNNFQSKITKGYDGFSKTTVNSAGSKDHATEIAGIIGANTNNDIGVSGVVGGNTVLGDYGATLLDLRSGKPNEGGQVLSAVYAVSDWGANWGNASILSQSFASNNIQHVDYFDLKDHYARLPSKGVVNSISVSNSNINFFNNNSGDLDGPVFGHHLPGCIHGDYIGLRTGSYLRGVDAWWESTYGSYLHPNAPGVMDLLAPGHEDLIYTTAVNGGYKDENGNSYATAFTSGAAAAIMGYYRFHHKGRMLVHEDVEELLERSALDIKKVPEDLIKKGANASIGYDAPTGWGQLQLGEALKGIEFPNYTIEHFYRNTQASVEMVEENVAITLTEPVESFLEKKSSTSNYTKYKADIYKVTITINYYWDNSYSLVPTDPEGRKGFWPHNSQAFYCGYDATNKVVEPYTDLQWKVEPTGNQGNAQLVGYLLFLRKKRGSTKRIDLYWPIDPSEEKLLHASFSAYLTKGWAQGLEPGTSGAIKVFPNPGQDLFHLEQIPSQGCGYRVVDVNGREVQKGNIPAGTNTFTIDLSNCDSGIYTLQTSNNEQVHNCKLVKQ